MTGPLADRLAAALRTGSQLDLIPATPVEHLLTEEEMRGWGPSHDVDADVLRGLLLRRRLDSGDPDPRGLQLRGARIRGRLDLDLVTSAMALSLEDCLLEHGITAEHAHLPVLILHQCRLSHTRRPALDAPALRTDGPLLLSGSMLATATGGDTIRLADARIGGRLDLRGARLRNPTGTALAADRLQAVAGVFLDQGFSAEGAGERGVIRLLGARIGGQINLSGATLRNATGPALKADVLQTVGGGFLADGLTAEGAGELSTLRLLGARIAGQLDLSGATLCNPTGSAIAADGLQTDDHVFLAEGFSADGAGRDGAVRLSGARIGGSLILRGATLRNPTGPALGADRLQTDEGVILDEGFTAEGSGERGVIRLVNARVGGELRAATGGTVRSSSDIRHQWDVDGLTYSGVPQPSGKAWLELLGAGTPRYTAQPYQQLAAAYRAEGHDGDVRQVLIAQRRDQIARGGLGRAERGWAKTTGLLLGYGYQPWRALLYLAGVLAVSVVLAFVLGAQGALARTTSPPTEPPMAPACTVVQTIGRGLDLGAPFLPATTAVVGSCQPTVGPAGDTLTAIRWVLQLATWALAALFIAGFTGIVRKT